MWDISLTFWLDCTQENQRNLMAFLAKRTRGVFAYRGYGLYDRALYCEHILL